MSFLSLKFALFLTLGLITYYAVPRRVSRHVLLTLSYLFYASTSVPYVLMLLGVTLTVYVAALIIDGNRNEGHKTAVAAVVVAGLVVIMFGFKCASWMSEILQGLWSTGGADVTLHIIAPLGVSYYLFKLIGYLLDVYWDKLRAERSFVSVALYASFFPQIVSGPIQRADDFISQLNERSGPDIDEIVAGLRRILFGLFKKFVVADPLVILVAGAHTNPSNYSSLELTVAAYCFALQLYADFSGITDIALGIGQLFGVKGPENFKTPFFASNVQDFWRRWHMSLTSWLSDYLFTPLRMSFRNLGNTGLAMAIFLNMIAVGVWHDLRWTFLIFGAINGVYMIISALTLKKRNVIFRSHPRMTKIRAVVGPLITFHLIVFAFIFFRANSLQLAVEYVLYLVPGLGDDNGIPTFRMDWPQLGVTAMRMQGVFIMALIMETINWASYKPYWRARFLSAPRPIRWTVIYMGIAMLAMYGHLTNVNFVYQQF